MNNPVQDTITCPLCKDGWPLVVLSNGVKVHELPEPAGSFTCFDEPKQCLKANPTTIPLVYIMSPYSDPSDRVRMNRYRTAEFYTSRLMQRFRSAMFYSPITYCHPIAEEFGLPTDLEFWREHDECMIARSQLGIVLRDRGWQSSEGVTWERSVFELQGTPYIYDDVDSEHEVVGQALQKLA